MSGWGQRFRETEMLAIGIEGPCSSLCGAIKRLERYGIQSDGLLSLREQCARYIARIKNEQVKWLITASLPTHLFQYVTKDIFNLKHHRFKSNYAKDYELCEACSTNTDKRKRKCRCPKLERAIEILNQYFFKRMNKNNNGKGRHIKKFELIYKLPDCDGNYSDYCDEPPLYFLHLPPCFRNTKCDMGDSDDEGYIPYHSCRLINQVSVEDKLLFVDVMRFLGAFKTKHEQPEYLLYNCFEQEL